MLSLPVLYVLAQISIQAVAATSNDPPLGRPGRPAGPTQGDQGQLPKHFTLILGTYPGPVLAHPRAHVASGEGNTSPWCPQ